MDVLIAVPEGVKVSTILTNLNAGIEGTMAAKHVGSIQELDNIDSVAGDDLSASIGIPQFGTTAEVSSALSSSLDTADLEELERYYA